MKGFIKNKNSQLLHMYHRMFRTRWFKKNKKNFLNHKNNEKNQFFSICRPFFKFLIFFLDELIDKLQQWELI